MSHDVFCVRSFAVPLLHAKIHSSLHEMTQLLSVLQLLFEQRWTQVASIFPFALSINLQRRDDGQTSQGYVKIGNDKSSFYLLTA